MVEVEHIPIMGTAISVKTRKQGRVLPLKSKPDILRNKQEFRLNNMYVICGRLLRCKKSHNTLREVVRELLTKFQEDNYTRDDISSLIRYDIKMRKAHKKEYTEC